MVLRFISPWTSVLSTLTIAIWYSSVEETSRPFTLDKMLSSSFIVLSSGICFSIESHFDASIWTIFYSSSSSIFFIALEYSLQLQVGIIHLPSFSNELFSVDSWASSVWWHFIQFMNSIFRSNILRNKNSTRVYFWIFKFNQCFIGLF